MDRRLIGLAAVGSFLAISLLGLLIARDTTPEAVSPAPPAPAVAPPAAPTASPQATRVPLPRPPDHEGPEVPRERLPTVEITAEERQSMNYAIDDVLAEARDDCLLPWIDDLEAPTRAEFVFDVVLYDGEIYDIGLRSLDLPLPASVSDCVAEVSWGASWPTWDLQGELRLQRSVAYRNAATDR